MTVWEEAIEILCDGDLHTVSENGDVGRGDFTLHEMVTFYVKAKKFATRKQTLK